MNKRLTGKGDRENVFDPDTLVRQFGIVKPGDHLRDREAEACSAGKCLAVGRTRLVRAKKTLEYLASHLLWYSGAGITDPDDTVPHLHIDPAAVVVVLDRVVEQVNKEPP